MGKMTVGNKSIASVFIGDARVNAVYLGHTIIYIYVGYTLLDSDGKFLLDADGNNLICS